MTCRLIAVLPAALAVVALMPTPSLRADERQEQQVEAFLSRLGLVDLQTRHLEQQLDRADAKQPLALARRLSDLYATRLMEAADDKQAYDDLLARIRKLGERYPEANTTALQVMLLQADFNRAQLQIRQWIADRSDTEALKSGAAILSRIAPQLQKYQKELNEEVEQLSLAIADVANPAEKQAKETELQRKREAAGRATFFAGWSNYYFALTQLAAGDAAPSIEAAREAFRRILGLGPEEKYEDVEAEWLGLESTYRARALIGLGLTEAAAGELAATERLFTLLDDVRTPPAIRDQAPAFHLQGLLNANHFEEAGELARTEIEGFSGAATQGKVSFCTALVRAGFGEGDDSPQRRQLGSLGVRGLARMQQIGAAYQVLAKYNVDLEEPEGFYLTWLKGYGQFAEAEKTKSEEGFRAAAETLRQALDDPEARQDVVSAGQCRHTLAWCHYRRKDYESAAEQFQQAATSLKDAAGDTALQSAWMVFASYYALVPKESRFALSAIDALETIKRDFPNSDRAKEADKYLGNLRQRAGSLEDAIETLEAIGPDESNYVAARYDLCRLYHQQWSKTKDPGEKRRWANKVTDGAESYSRIARNDSNEERKLRCQLWAADVVINSTPLDAKRAASFLDKAEALLPGVPAGSSAVIEYHYRRLQMAQRENDEAAALKEADWLATNAAGSVYEISALVILAKDVQQALSSAAPSDRRALVEKAADIYRRLARAVGQTPKVIAEVKNAQVANARLAEYELELGNYRPAADCAERLLTAFPDDRNYLRVAGLSEYHLGDYDKAIERWRTLVLGLKKNSPEWHEAKYYQLASLLHLDKPAAEKAYQQFQLLYPSVTVEPWTSDPEGLRTKLAG